MTATLRALQDRARQQQVSAQLLVNDILMLASPARDFRLREVQSKRASRARPGARRCCVPRQPATLCAAALCCPRACGARMLRAHCC